MKWIKKDIYGNKQVWYSEDVINTIKEYINSYKNNCKQKGYCLDDRLCDTCVNGNAIELGDEILEVIEKP